MDFAEKQLLKYGWVRGEGLGKGKNGISEPIKVKLKRDSTGVGSAPGSEFTSNWWDKVFNSAASGIKVKNDKKGEVVIEAGQDTSASLKKRHYNSHKKTLKYGGFLDCTSVQQQQEMGVVTEQRQDDDGARESEDVSHDLEGEWSHNVVAGGRIDDRILLEACGGRTAHKGARHGLTLSGKLARIERQEAAVLPLRESAGACMEESVQNTGKKKKKSMQVDRKGKPKRLKKSASAIISTC